MRLLFLEIQNLGPYQGEHQFDLASRGVVSIVGRNGGGKSWILDALLWAGWGETGPRRASLQSTSGLKSGEVVNEVVEKDALAVLTFEGDDGLKYKIKRWRENKAFHKSQGVSLESVGDTVEVIADLDKGNVQEEINRRLGMDYDLATRVILRSQEDPFNFAQATPKERFEILTVIEGVGELDDRAAVAREKANDLVKKSAALESDIRANDQAVALYEGEDHAESSRAWAAERDRKIAVATATVDRENERHAAVVAEVEKLPALAEQAEELAARLPSLEQQTPAGLEDWQAHLGSLNTAHATASAHHGAVVEKLGKILANGSGVCGACGQAVTIEHLESHRAQLESEASTHQSHVLAARSSIQEAEKTIAEATAQAEKQNADNRQKRDAALAELATVRAVVSQIERARAALSPAALDQARQAVDDLQKEKDPYEHRAAEIKARVETIQAKTADYVTQRDALAVEAQLLSWWIRHIPSLKSWIFDAVVGEITAEANKWLTALMGGRCWVSIDSTSVTKGGEARDKLGLRCFEWRPDGSYIERAFRKWSGGEKRRISLAVDWALSARLAQRAHANCSFLALDEVDRSLDAEGREALLAALEELKKTKETVLVVSHDVELQAAPDVKWYVTKDAAGSHVEEVHG